MVLNRVNDVFDRILTISFLTSTFLNSVEESHHKAEPRRVAEAATPNISSTAPVLHCMRAMAFCTAVPIWHFDLGLASGSGKTATGGGGGRSIGSSYSSSGSSSHSHCLVAWLKLFPLAAHLLSQPVHLSKLRPALSQSVR